MEPIALEPVDAVTVTTLVDNVTDALLVVRARQSAGPTFTPFTLATAGEILRASSTGSPASSRSRSPPRRPRGSSSTPGSPRTA